MMELLQPITLIVGIFGLIIAIKDLIRAIKEKKKLDSSK